MAAPRGIAFILTLFVIVAALFAGWLGTTRVIYFDPDLSRQSSGCGARGDEAVIDEFEADWYGDELRSLGEPSLYLRSRNPVADITQTFRLVWLRSFHEPVSVRVELRSDGSAHLTAKQRPIGLHGQARDLSRPLTPGEMEKLTDALESTQVLVQPAKTCALVADGSRWIIEASDQAGRYVYINRNSPKDGPVREFGEVLLDLTGWNEEPVY